MYGINPQRTNARATGGLSAARARALRGRRIELPGTVDSSPIYLGAVRVRGARRGVFVVTTTYGRTLALDARTGRRLWTFTPPGYRRWAGTYQITTASPVADPDRRWVYATSPDGRLHKLRLADGRERTAGAWPVRLTLLAAREKLPSALTVWRRYVIAATGGYIGDEPPYQGHVVAVDRASGRRIHVWNALCANLHRLLHPAGCRASDAAIWGRAAPVIEPSGRLLVATGNAPFNGRTDWGDSVLELAPGATRLTASYTPRDQGALNAADADLGSTVPALLGGGLVLQGGKDGVLKLLDLAALHRPGGGGGPLTGGELQRLPAPGGAGVFTTPAVWRTQGRTLAFVTTGAATAAYELRGRRLQRVWQHDVTGTSPLVVGGLLWVYDPDRGDLNVYRAASGAPVARLAAAPGHWNSPVVAGGRVALPVGDANDHSTRGTLILYG